MAKSLNKVQLIGNLTRDPELRYTPSGAAVASFGIATNRSWTTDTGEKKEEVEFHNVVAWRKLAEICSQYLTKGKKVFVEGRLATRQWTSQDGQQKSRTEVVIEDMIMLDSRGGSSPVDDSAPKQSKAGAKKKSEEQEDAKGAPAEAPVPAGNMDQEISPDDIPF